MNTPATFFPIPAALQQPHLLDDILAASQHVLSTGSVVVPDIHPLSLLAVHGLYLSRRRMPDDRCELTATNPEAFRQWLNHVWFPLQHAALEKDPEAFFSAEVSLLAAASEQQASPVLCGMIWASLAALHFTNMPSGPATPIHAFRMARRVSDYLLPVEHAGERLPLSLRKSLGFPDSGAGSDVDVLTPGWLAGFILRSERVFTCFHRQSGTTISALPAGASSAQPHPYASEQVPCRTPGSLPGVSAGEKQSGPETAGAPDHKDQSYPARPTDPAEEE